MNWSQTVSEYLPKVADLPLILAGPILRRTESDRVTVWLALKEPRSLQIQVYKTSNQGSTVGKVVLEATANTVELGKHLHIIAITAKPKDSELLQLDTIYAYNIFCNNDDSKSDAGDRFSLLDDLKSSIYSLSYFDHQLPTFSLPPQDLNRLKIIHGSCRKPHGGGKDTLSCIDNLILKSASSASDRPHQLFLTGDQIYGDDVADPILWLARGVGQLLFGWSEELPLMSGTIYPEKIPPGQRTKIAEIEGGLTGMLIDQPEKTKSHLFSFSEYVAAYLLAWSPVLMPASFPSGKSLFKDRQQRRSWQKEIKDIESFVRDLNYVRRGLANIPVYTICDDHDVSDDWYLNRRWCDRVLGKPLGKRIVQNGLLAYSLFQAWGNTPEKFAADTGGEKLIQLASQWSMSQGKDLVAKAECDRYLGIPRNDDSTGLPKYRSDEDVLVLARDSEAIPWHYTIYGQKHEVIVLDTRTWRGYPSAKEEALKPPMLLSPTAFRQQLQTPLKANNPEIEATVVVLPTNLVALGLIDRIQKLELKRGRVFNSDVGDSWNFHTDAFAQLLLTLCQQRQRIIILSGDIHYSCAVRLDHWFHDSSEASVIVQLTSSAIKNSELATRIAHTKLKSLFPEKNQRWLGWNKPLKLKEVDSSKKYLNSTESLPDWQYRIQWCKRQPARSFSSQKSPRELTPQGYSLSPTKTTNLWQKLVTGLIDRLWRNPWLQEGTEVIGRNNISLVRFQWSTTKTAIQETYWYPPWNDKAMVQSRYEVSLETEPMPKLNSK